jgi:hypothetical protein
MIHIFPGRIEGFCVSADFVGKVTSMLTIVAGAGALLLSCATTSKTTEPGENNSGSYSTDGMDGREGEARVAANLAQYVNTKTSASDLCVGAWTSEVSTVTFQRAPEGTLAWGFKLSNQARALLGPVVTVTMPYSYVNGRPISPPYSPHMEENTYNFHSSMNHYRLIGGGGGSLQTGDRVTFFWLIRGSTDTAAYRLILCQVPPPSSG